MRGMTTATRGMTTIINKKTSECKYIPRFFLSSNPVGLMDAAEK